jgi:hypothetical protein
MLPASHPLLYACVFRDTTHLVADLPPTDAAARDDLPTLAAALVAAAPPHHRHLTHSAAGRAHALLLAPPLALAAVSRAPDLPAAQLLLFLRRLRCVPEDRMRGEMPRLAMRLPLPPPPDDEAALAREERDVAAAEAEAEAEQAARRDADLAARRTPKRDRRGGGGAAAAWAWRRQLWIVILVDLVLLAVLFAAWLAVCRGFSCIGR